MAQKPQYISPDLLIHPGETILEVIEDRGISQKELAIRTGYTEKHISTVLRGKKSISAKFALRLETALDIASTFWENLQMNYDLEVETFKELNNITSEELQIAKAIARPVETITGKKLDTKKEEFAVWDLRRLLGVSLLTSIDKLNPGFYRAQFNVNADKYIMYAWQYLSEKACESQSTNALDIDTLQSDLNELKQIMFEPFETHITKLTDFFNTRGVLFTVNKHVSGAPVHGLTVKTKNDKVMIAMTIRNKYVDTFWFSLFHELAHVLNKDYLKNQSNPSKTKALEDNADTFAQNTLIDPNLYAVFVNQGDFSEPSIKKFAEMNNVLPSIVAGRLMMDEYIPWSQNNLRVQYQWDD